MVYERIVVSMQCLLESDLHKVDVLTGVINMVTSATFDLDIISKLETLMQRLYEEQVLVARPAQPLSLRRGFTTCSAAAVTS